MVWKTPVGVLVLAAACLLPAATGWADELPVTPTPTEPIPTETPAPEPPEEPLPKPTDEPLPKRFVIGTSVRGTDIVARRLGDADAPRVLLVLGQMHGDEPYGRYVVDQLNKLTPRKGTAIWTIRTLNPDGAARFTRKNARRVDLNRNFPAKWNPSDPASLYYSGIAPASEPETRAFIRAARTIRPDAVVSYHQHLNVVDKGRGKARKWSRRLSRDLDLPMYRVSCVTKCNGTMTGWFNKRFPGWAVTVELPKRISVGRQKSMARAMVRLAPDLRP